MPIRKSQILAITIASVASSTALAQYDKPTLEEVLVTATKREQSLQEIPLSVAAVTGEKLNETGTKTLADLTTLVPNIHFTQTGLSTQMRIRGIGSDNSQGFEQSVGVYVDGIFRGRAQLFRAPMFDMERVEVMRGPQSTLFGKNSIAGALDLITAKPTEELSGYLTGSYEAEYGATELTTVVSGPLSDTLRGRIALRKMDDPGYMENTFKGTDEPEHDVFSGRVSLEWEPNESTLISYIGERSTFDTVGRPVELTRDSKSLIPATHPTSGALSGLTYQQILTGAFGASTFDTAQNYQRQTDAPEYSNNKTTAHTIEIEWESDSGYSITSLTGSVEYDYDENCDCDFTPAPIFALKLDEDYKQFSQEIRVASPQGNAIEWIGGMFFQSYDQNFKDTLAVPTESVIVTSATISTYRGVIANLAAQNGLTYEQASMTPSIVAAANDLSTLVRNDFGNSGISRDFTQESSTQALFGQMTWNMSDDFRLILGARYTHESKRGDKELHTVDTVTGEYQPVNAVLQSYELPSAANIYSGNQFRVDTVESLNLLDPDTGRVSPGHTISDTRSENAFTPLLIAQWDISDDTSTYISWTKGFKAGGFDPRSNRMSAFGFDEEKAKALELGFKTTTWDDRNEVNVALYRTDYEDLQISQFDGAVSFNVGNAKETRVQGLEVDGRVAISSHLVASYGVSLLDFEYIEFKNGNCYFGQAANGVDTNGDGINECDYTGKSGVYTPDYTINLGFDYRRDIGQSLEFAAILDTQFVDGHQVHVNLDPEGEIDSYGLVGLRLQIGGEHWHAAILGKNLLDEEIVTYSANAPLSESTFQTNTYYSFINRPRTVALEASFKF